jgi:hypothetical protein
MQCVRILWPLKPGEFKKMDNAARFEAALKAGNSTKGLIQTTHGISEFDFHYVRHFHNITRPRDWMQVNYPVNTTKERIVLREVDTYY